ncbi:endonuclease/exonuclease/phosphatase family protein [Ferruginibacter sp.]|nr:endonuclease/exonuclease/phosphatase family protein [Ferruginibacter sp.]
MALKIKKVFKIFIVTATIAIIVVYLLACFAPFLEAGKHTYFALLGLISPLLFFILLSFLAYWCILKSKWALVCIAALVISWRQVTVMFSFHFPKKFDVIKADKTLRVLSWNLSSWGESGRTNKTNNIDTMVSLIKGSNADVLCLQEFLYFKEKKYRDSIVPALKASGYEYSYFVRSKFPPKIYTSTVLTAIVIISKYPIVDSAHFFYNDDDFTEPLIYADVKVNNDTVRFFTTHLQSVKFEEYEYYILKKFKKLSNVTLNRARAIILKLKEAYKKRALQAELMHEKIQQSPYPAIVCGDFNDVPTSYTYNTVKGNLQDAFLKKGSGFGRTFRFISPTLRIDNILADIKFEVMQFNKFEVPYSDHYPVIADLKLTGK